MCTANEESPSFTEKNSSPAWAGLNTTENVLDWPGCSIVAGDSSNEESAASGPEIVGVGMVMGPCPVLTMVYFTTLLSPCSRVRSVSVDALTASLMRLPLPKMAKEPRVSVWNQDITERTSIRTLPTTVALRSVEKLKPSEAPAWS